MRRHIAPKEYLGLIVAVDTRTQHIAHAPAGHHVARKIRGALEIVGGAGGHLAHKHLFGDAPAHEHRNRSQQRFAVMAVAVLLRQLHRGAERPPTRDDGHLVHRIGIGQGLRDHRVPGLVIRRIPAFFFRHHKGTPFRAHDDLVLGLLEILHVHQTLVGARGEQRRLVHQVGEIGAGETGRPAGDYIRVHVFGDRHLAHVHLEDQFASAYIRQRHVHLAVETAGAQERGVEHIGAVGGGDHDDAFVALKAVHLHQQLVQRLFALVVAAA